MSYGGGRSGMPLRLDCGGALVGCGVGSSIWVSERWGESGGTCPEWEMEGAEAVGEGKMATGYGCGRGEGMTSLWRSNPHFPTTAVI